MTVPGFEFTIHVSNIQVNWPGNYGHMDCVFFYTENFIKMKNVILNKLQ